MKYIEFLDFGYCRVSTHKQNIERQERNILSAYPLFLAEEPCRSCRLFPGKVLNLRSV